MNSKQKRVDVILRELYGIHEELFGQKYSIGLTLDQKSEYNRIIDEFRELIFTIKSTQEEREHKENNKNFKSTPEKVKINYQIRQDIERAEGILKQAAKRLKGGEISKEILENRNKQLKNCYQLLQDVKQCEEGGVYKPPEYPTLQQIKMKLLDRPDKGAEPDEELNMEEQQAFDQFNEKDRKMDDVLDEIIDVNKKVRGKIINSNQAIDYTHDKIKKLNNKTDKLITRVQKADKDLAQILKTYQRPSQLCLNITLILMVLALIAVIINLIKSPIK